MEQLNAELANQEKRAKELARKDNKSSSASSSRAVKWGDSVQDLLSGGGTFHTNSAINSVLASAGAPLFDTITNSQYQGNVGILQLSSFGRAPNDGRGANNAGNDGAGDAAPNGQADKGTREERRGEEQPCLCRMDAASPVR